MVYSARWERSDSKFGSFEDVGSGHRFVPSSPGWYRIAYYYRGVKYESYSLEVTQSGGGYYYRDGDGDGFGIGSRQYRCTYPEPGWADINGDCDDSDNNIFPGAPTQCDGLDRNCDNLADNPPTAPSVETSLSCQRDPVIIQARGSNGSYRVYSSLTSPNPLLTIQSNGANVVTSRSVNYPGGVGPKEVDYYVSSYEGAGCESARALITLEWGDFEPFFLDRCRHRF